MFDITLYGHLAIDKIQDGNKITMNFGGMANMVRTFQDIGADISLGLSPLVLGEANIYINREDSTRDSVADLNRVAYDSPIRESHISHILYINRLDNTDFIPNLTGIVTADTCKGHKVDLQLLKYVDYLFMSYEEMYDIEELIEHTKGSVIIHSAVSSVIHNKKDKKVYFIDPSLYVKDAYVLGAGDMFASCFLYE